jgi:hypothetical protein
VLSRPKAYFINGGAGRVICSIPAFEELEKTGEDFIIVCEGGMELYKGHPTLHKRAYDHWHKGLFEQHIKHRDIVSPEPYRVWEYYNQKCNLSQAFDIEINNKGVRDLPPPTIISNQTEVASGHNVVQEVKAKTGFDKVLIVQPFGRGVQNMGEMVIDPSSRSFTLTSIVEIINELKKEYAVIVMSEFPIALEEKENTVYPVAMPQIPDIRIWTSIIGMSDHFLGCDSLGQHIAHALGKTATVVTGSTYPINITYPDHKNFDVIDIGKDTRIYDPIRISMEDAVNRANDETMEMTKEEIQQVLQSVRKRLGKSTKFKGKFIPPQQNNEACCPPSTPAITNTIEQKPLFSTVSGSLQPLQIKQ